MLSIFCLQGTRQIRSVASRAEVRLSHATVACELAKERGEVEGEVHSVTYLGPCSRWRLAATPHAHFTVGHHSQLPTPVQACSPVHVNTHSNSLCRQFPVRFVFFLFSFVFSAREQLFLSILLIRGVPKWPWISPRGMLSTPYDSDSDWINNTVSADHTAHLETAETEFQAPKPSPSALLL